MFLIFNKYKGVFKNNELMKVYRLFAKLSCAIYFSLCYLLVLIHRFLMCKHMRNTLYEVFFFFLNECFACLFTRSVTNVAFNMTMLLF